MPTMHWHFYFTRPDGQVESLTALRPGDAADEIVARCGLRDDAWARLVAHQEVSYRLPHGGWGVAKIQGCSDDCLKRFGWRYRVDIEPRA